MPESTSETVEAVPVNPVGFETPKNTGSFLENKSDRYKFLK